MNLRDPQQTSERPAGPVVLLVDDQMIVAAAVRQMLAGEPDIAFHYCQTAAEVLGKVEAIRPTTILQDLVMPDVDGFAMLERLRADAASATVPVIVLSSKEDPQAKSRAFAQGASDYLVKLPDKIELVARIRAHSRSYLAQTQRDAAFRALDELRRQLEEKNAMLERLSSVDGLTGIANRRRFDQELDAEWRRARRERREMSLILIDVDYFKRYNDHYGHLGGDDCLRRVASALASAVHRGGDLVARYGGEEFVVILPGTDRDGATAVAETMRAAVEALAVAHARSDVAAHVTISLGSVTLTPDGDDPTVLVTAADKALYAAKQAGRNQHHSAA